MPKKIMFIKPAHYGDAVWDTDTTRTSHPLGLWWLASDLKQRGHEIRLLDETVRLNGLQNQSLFKKIIDTNGVKTFLLQETPKKFKVQKMKDFAQMNPYEFVKKYSAFRHNRIERNVIRTGTALSDTIAEVDAMRPDIVGIPIFASCNYEAAIELAEAIKKAFPTVSIVMGGEHVTGNPYSVDKDFVDHIITGDANNAMRMLAESQGTQKQKIIHGDLILAFDNFPLLDMEIMRENIYPTPAQHTYNTQDRKWVDYMFSKGCYRNCEFCCAGRKPNIVSSLSFEAIDEQLQIFSDEGIREIIVQDDAFFNKPDKYLVEYLALMKNHGMYWQDNGGVEFEGLKLKVVMDALEKYQTHGKGKINALYVPINPRAGSEGKSAILEMKERYSKNFDMLKRLKKTGIYLCTSEILGYPGKSLEQMEEDIFLHKALIEEGYVDKAMSFVTSYFPGTALYDKYKQNIVNIQDWMAYSNLVPQATTKHIQDISAIERLVVKRYQVLNTVQNSYGWDSAFPNT